MNCISLYTVEVSIEITTSIRPVIGMGYYLTCTVTGADQLDPTITYQWYKDGSVLFNETELNFTIDSLTYTDAGGYMCVANVSSEHLSQHFTTKASSPFNLRFTTGIIVLYCSLKVQ